ncbi:hypothetical protein [Microbulbifer sp. VAAF005]|uniref:hypothetical protein n=1 Tax=Microbulbifer sp. VAAF005 TaxID=3034230 RepID=UPI0024ACB3D6|nr:hypothetical protein [Microbulbifer sp. VAAF005]WHI46708.1 hypothetical protein P0078_23915 [Microbulbifer sp. VAAF005]
MSFVYCWALGPGRIRFALALLQVLLPGFTVLSVWVARWSGMVGNWLPDGPDGVAASQTRPGQTRVALNVGDGDSAAGWRQGLGDSLSLLGNWAGCLLFNDK